MQIGTAIMENSREVPQKTKSRAIISASNPTPGHIIQKRKKLSTQKDTCTSTFTAALLTTAKMWKQPKCPSTDG